MNSQLLYLRDVLGIESWISTTSVETSPPRLTIVKRRTWNEQECGLVEKILAATALTGEVCDIDDLGKVRSPHVLIIDSETEVGKIAVDGRTSWNLGRLQKLLVGTPEEIQNSKREVWSLLKALKEEIAR